MIDENKYRIQVQHHSQGGCEIMKRIAICDDHKADLTELKMLIERYFGELSIGIAIYQYDDGQSLVADIEKHIRIFDVVFLDVDMPLLSGFQTAKRIGELKTPCLLVFVTNMEQHAREGYKYAAFRYVYKSRLTTEMKEAVVAIAQKLALIEKEEQTLLFKYKEGEEFETLEIYPNDILYLKMEKTRRVFLKTIYAEYNLLIKPLAEYQAMLDSFILVTRNYLINMNRIDDIDDEYFILSNGEEISIGFTPETKKQSREKYLEYLKERS
jgi:DNA-binding LytR/AlgR family response regulator